MSNDMDYAKLAEGLDDMREMLRAMLAGLVADGYTEEQGRAIITGFFTLAGKEEQP